MAFQAGKGSILKLDNSGGTLVDLSAYITNVDFPEEVATHETSAFGNNSRTFIAGLKSGTIGLQGHWDSGAAAIDAHMSGIKGQSATVTFEYGPEGGTTGKVRYTGEAILTRYTKTSPVDGPVDWSADLQISGDVTRNTF